MNPKDRLHHAPELGLKLVRAEPTDRPESRTWIRVDREGTETKTWTWDEYGTYSEEPVETTLEEADDTVSAATLEIPAGETESPVLTLAPAFLPIPPGAGWQYNDDLTGQVTTAETWRTTDLLPAGLSVDKDGDGFVGGAEGDQTSSERPFRFWINNDQDSFSQGGTNGQSQDVAGEVVPPKRPDSEDGRIVERRDLEDFTRLHLSLGGMHQEITDGEIEVGLVFEEIFNGTPRIKLYRAADESGGSDGYLREESAANEQIAGDFGQSIATISASGVTWLSSTVFSEFANNGGKAYFLFEGLLEGQGKLTLALRKDGSEFARGKLLDVRLMDIKKMYQRALATANGVADDPYAVPEPTDYGHPHAGPEEPEMGWRWNEGGYGYIEDPDETKDYIVFVHGWRMTYEGAHSYAETMYKRFWQSGYRGRFACLRWPTYSEDTHPNLSKLTYNISDYRAWKSGTSLASFVNSLPEGYSRNLAAHSQGNIVASCALREGMEVDYYALQHAAAPAMCYDSEPALHMNISGDVTPAWVQTFFDGIGEEIDDADKNKESPDDHEDAATRQFGFADKFAESNGAQLINFLLEDDEALKIWMLNNLIMKPDESGFDWSYHYYPGRVQKNRLRIEFSEINRDRSVVSLHEALAYLTSSHTRTIGTERFAGGSINKRVDMDSEFGFGKTHSAEWIWGYLETYRCYARLMSEFNLDHNIEFHEK